ncbi:hypothetical protein ALC53_08066 [Atta colombica]|uniref:Integrase catalytic domain-containing protein n=1 Tax=Atta colombica TaxID=520822 RepID=A0A151I2T3_9HYME|nr:hypothetical protein ALC53_08066 [Atta colombica]
MLENRIYLTSTVSTSQANRSNVTSIHPSNSNIRRSVVSVIVMRTDEESRHNDLRRSLRYLISWRHTRRKFVYRVHAFIVAVRARGYVILDVQLCFRRFFSEIRGFIVKNWLYIYDNFGGSFGQHHIDRLRVAKGSLVSRIRNQCGITRTYQMDDISAQSDNYTMENICEHHFLDNVSQNSQGRYTVKLPVREQMLNNIGDSRESALRICILGMQWNQCQDTFQFEIQHLTEIDSWRHVASSDIPADILCVVFTRLNNDLPEQRKIRVAASTSHPCIIDDLLNKYSNLNKIFRIIAYCLRLSKAHREHAVSTFISPVETSTALNCICRTMQQRAFYREYQALTLTNLSLINHPFKRFISRRGRPAHMYSDNGTTFVSVHRQIQELYDIYNDQQVQSEIKNFLRKLEISWSFISSNAPHFGGLWEAAVKSAKYHMTQIVGKAHFIFEEMQTTFCEIEAILNSRHLLPLSADLKDLAYLSSGHFLVGMVN